MAIDSYFSGNYKYDPLWYRELESVSHRDYATGYYFSDSHLDANLSSTTGYIKDKAYLEEVCKNGAGVDFSEEKAKEILLEDKINIVVDLNDGNYSSTAWGCDLTYDYVKINGDYRT